MTFMSDIYEAGRTAFAAGVKECPYGRSHGDHRIIRWWHGWLDAQTERNLGYARKHWGDIHERGRAGTCIATIESA